MNFHVAFWLMMIIAGGIFWIGGLFVARMRRLEKIVDEKMAIAPKENLA
jgi:hypothetical protein